MAVIGKAKAVVHIGTWKLDGFLAWLLWGGVHILSAGGNYLKAIPVRRQP